MSRGKFVFSEKDKDDFERLCGLQCTKFEICSFFKISDKTLDRIMKKEYKKSFSDVFAEKRALGFISLRRSQFRMAQNNPALAIFLGKNWLHQKDKIDEPKDATEYLKDIAELMKTMASPKENRDVKDFE